MTRIVLLVPALALLAASSVAQERVYRWVDAQGVVHYSQTPPDKIKAEERAVHVPAPAKQQADAGAPADAPAETPCDVARRNRDALLSGKAVGADTNGDGKPDPMSEADRQAAMDLNARQLAAFCKPAAAPAEASTTRPPPG